MRLLFSHCNFPAQFRRLAPWLAERGHEVVFLCEQREWHAPEAGAIRLVGYEPARATGAAHPYLGRIEAAVLTGQAAYRAAVALRESQGFEPDLIISHAGFGSGLYLRDAFPAARRIGLFEWYYNSSGGDVDYLRAGAVPPDQQLQLRSWNMPLLLELAQCEAAVVPTAFQRQQFPEPWRSRMHQIHEGIEVAVLARLRAAPPPRPAWMPTDPELELVTYVSRGFEVYRCFPEAMAALALLQQRRPRVHVLIAGEDVVCYGGGSPPGRSWGSWARAEAGLDPERTHWLGALQTADYHALLAHSQAHLYLTIPFVLSWSLLEAMAAGCPIVASATPPVQEMITADEEGWLVSPRDPAAIAEALEACLAQPALAATRAARAAARAARYDASLGLRQWQALIEASQPPMRDGDGTVRETERCR